MVVWTSLKGKEFKEVMRQGKTYRGQLLRLCVSQADTGSRSVGFVVPKKNKQAVLRNRVRRLLRESFRLLCDSIKPSRVVFFCYNYGKNIEYKVVFQDMKWLFNKACLHV